MCVVFKGFAIKNPGSSPPIKIKIYIFLLIEFWSFHVLNQLYYEYLPVSSGLACDTSLHGISSHIDLIKFPIFYAINLCGFRLAWQILVEAHRRISISKWRSRMRIYISYPYMYIAICSSGVFVINNSPLSIHRTWIPSWLENRGQVAKILWPIPWIIQPAACHLNCILCEFIKKEGSSLPFNMFGAINTFPMGLGDVDPLLNKSSVWPSGSS